MQRLGQGKQCQQAHCKKYQVASSNNLYNKLKFTVSLDQFELHNITKLCQLVSNVLPPKIVINYNDQEYYYGPSWSPQDALESLYDDQLQGHFLRVRLLGKFASSQCWLQRQTMAMSKARHKDVDACESEHSDHIRRSKHVSLSASTFLPHAIRAVSQKDCNGGNF